MLWLNKHARHRNNLSPYVDGRLTTAETADLEAHLAACESCRHELEELRATVAAVRDLPQLEAPRSFALTPQMLEQRRAIATAPSTPPLAIGMRMASAAIAVVLAVVVIGDLSEGGNGGGGDGALESASKSRDTMEFAAGTGAEQGSDEPAAAVPAPTGIGEQDGARATDGNTPLTPAPPAGNLAAACPNLGDQTAAGGGASSATPAPGATGQPAPASTGGSGTNSAGAGAAGGATGGCDENAIAADQDSTAATAAAAEAPVGTINDDEAPEAAASSVDNDDGVSTLGVVEVVLAGALIVLLVGVAADFILRRRRLT